MDDKSDESVMVIQIDFEDEVQGEVKVRFGDNPKLLADAFCQEHGIDITLAPAIAYEIAQSLIKALELEQVSKEYTRQRHKREKARLKRAKKRGASQ